MLNWLSSPNLSRNVKSPSPTLSRNVKSPTLANQAKNHVLDGITLMRRGDLENAGAMFQKAITCDHECAEAYSYKALILNPLAPNEEKIVLYTTILQLSPNDLMAHYGMSCIKEAAGDLNSAYALRKEITDHKAKTVRDYKAQALCTGDSKKYLALLTAAGKLDKEDPSVHYMIAQYWFEEKNYVKSLASTVKALDIDPHYVDALSLKGDVLGEMDKYPESLAVYSAALEVNPNDIHSLTYKAKALYKHHQYEKSLELSRKIIKTDPANHLGYSYIATSLSGMGENAEALTAINKALELAPKDVLYHCQRAKIYMLLNNVDYAVKDLNEAFKLHNEQHISPRDNDSAENFVQSALDQRAELIEKLAKLSSPSLDTMYGAEEKHTEAMQLQEERKVLITDVVENLGAPRRNTIEKLHEKTERILELECEISHLRKEKNSELLEKIESNEHLTRYLEGFALTWSQTFTASQSVTSGIVKINTENWAVTAASLLVSFIPFCSDLLSTITQIAGDLIIKANILQHAHHFVQIAPNHTRLDIIAEAVGMKAATYFEEQICNPDIGKKQAAHWWNQVAQAVTNIGGAIEEKMFGELYTSYEAKLGHYHASKIIGEISAGKVDLSHKNTLPNRLFDILLGLEDTTSYIEVSC